MNTTPTYSLGSETPEVSQEDAAFPVGPLKEDHKTHVGACCEPPSSPSTSAGGSTRDDEDDSPNPSHSADDVSGAPFLTPEMPDAPEKTKNNAFAIQVLILAGMFAKEPAVVERVEKCIKFMRDCDFECEDIYTILAHATAYFETFYGTCGNRMSEAEGGYIFVVFVYIAHCYVRDETCPIKYWHLHLFRRYCTLPKLDKAVMKLLKARGYKLRVEEQDVSKRFAFLVSAARS